MLKDKLLKANKRGALEITGVRPLDEFYLITGKDFLLLKKVKEISPLSRFEALSSEIQANLKEAGIKKSEIAKAIKWSRKK